jgi:hypothetical protein
VKKRTKARRADCLVAQFHEAHAACRTPSERQRVTRSYLYAARGDAAAVAAISQVRAA